MDCRYCRFYDFEDGCPIDRNSCPFRDDEDFLDVVDALEGETPNKCVYDTKFECTYDPECNPKTGCAGCGKNPSEASREDKQ